MSIEQKIREADILSQQRIELLFSELKDIYEPFDREDLSEHCELNFLGIFTFVNDKGGEFIWGKGGILCNLMELVADREESGVGEVFNEFFGSKLKTILKEKFNLKNEES